MTSRKAQIAATGVLGTGLFVAYRFWSRRLDGPALGYVDGVPTPIAVVTINGKPVEVNTARAFEAMRDAASRERVRIKVVSGFRTMVEQQRLYDCYRSGGCNNGNFAAEPGFSNHQSGHALDLNTREAGVEQWLTANAALYGFSATIPGEPWHWEFWETRRG